MNPVPTGRISKNASGTYDLSLTREFKADIDDVWASVTEPERTARWFGTWRGEPGPGRTVQVQLGFEEGAPWSEAHIDDCRPPHHLALSMVDENGEVRLELDLVEDDGLTRLVFVQKLTDPAAAESMGPGWEYYLDQLVASREGQPLPKFEDYYPAQAPHFVPEAEQAER
jgi:uncharacterized protein YndB with AHSA1/START domain